MVTTLDFQVLIIENSKKVIPNILFYDVPVCFILIVPIMPVKSENPLFVNTIHLDRLNANGPRDLTCAWCRLSV
jgi:hypothetical protein